MDAVRIGLIGAGVIGATHSIVLREIAKVLGSRLQLVAVADPLPERRAECAATYRYAHSFADGFELLAKADIDAAFICTPTHSHAELVHAAAARGLHIFCEKPLAMSAAEAAAMVQAVEGA